MFLRDVGTVDHCYMSGDIETPGYKLPA
jgi:hypothetical protein